MTSLKTFLTILALLLSPATSFSETRAQPDLLRAFANCAGRLSAEVQHQWLMSDPEADQTQSYRIRMIELLDAVMPDGEGRTALRHRSEARQAHAALLTRASFNDDQRDAKWARRRADAEISQCRALMIH